MITKLTIQKDICNRYQDVYLTKEIIERENWLFYGNIWNCKMYYIRTDFRHKKCIHLGFMYGKYYIFKYIEPLNGIDKKYPDTMLNFFRENKIVVPDKFDTVNLGIKS